MKHFAVGDTVRNINHTDKPYGCIGTVVIIDDCDSDLSIGVNYGGIFDGNYLASSIDTDTGWWSGERDLELIHKIHAPIRFENVNRADPKMYPLPKRSTQHAAGYDFCIPLDACNYEKHGINYLMVPPGGYSELIRTRVKFQCPVNMFLALHPRNSTGTKKRCRLVNSSGIIDADYYNNPKNDGDIGAVLHNFGSEPAFFAKGEAFMQGIIQKYYVTDNDSTTTLREGATFFGEN